MEKLKDTIFYSLEKAIKTYRQFAQRNIKEYIGDITIDQWLVLKTFHENPDISQKELANQIFKDYASVTRIIDILVKKNYLQRELHPSDRRRHKIRLTDYAHNQFEKLFGIVKQNRKKALMGINQNEIKQLNITIEKIISNIQTISTENESKNDNS